MGSPLPRPVAHPYPPVEILPGALYAVGANISLDARVVSWAPPGVRGFKPMSCHVLLGDEALIVDPGPRLIEEAVVSGLRQLLPDGSPPAVFVSRSQLDVAGNIAALAAAYSLSDRMYTGGARNPFDAFDAVGALDPKRATPMEIARTAKPAGRLKAFQPKLRLLTTFWSYDEETKTMFTSDAFTHANVERADARPVVDSLDADSTTHADVRADLLANFWWLEHAHTPAIVEWLRSTFEEYDVEVIAPARGCALKGRDVVRHHVQLVAEVLAQLTEAHG